MLYSTSQVILMAEKRLDVMKPMGARWRAVYTDSQLVVEKRQTKNLKVGPRSKNSGA